MNSRSAFVRPGPGINHRPHDNTSNGCCSERFHALLPSQRFEMEQNIKRIKTYKKDSARETLH